MDWRDFGFSTRTRTVLLNAGINSLYELMQTSEAELLRQPSVGPMTVLEIAERVPLSDTTPMSIQRMRERLTWRRNYHSEYRKGHA